MLKFQLEEKSSVMPRGIFGEKCGSQVSTLESWAFGPLETQGTHSTVSGCLRCKIFPPACCRELCPLASSWDFSWTQTCVPTVPETWRGLKTPNGRSTSPRLPLGCCLDSFLKKRVSGLVFFCQRLLYWNGHCPGHHCPACQGCSPSLG